MSNKFLVFLLASSILTPVSSGAAEIKTPIANISVEQDWPKSRDQKNAPVEPPPKNAPKAVVEPKPADEKPQTLKMQPIYEKPVETQTKTAPKPEPKDDGRSRAKTIYSNVNGGQRVIVTFNRRPKLLSSAKEGDKYVIKLGGEFEYTPPPVPASFAKSFKSVSKSGNSVVVEFQPGSETKISNNATMIIVDVKAPKTPEEKAKEEEAKKKAEEQKLEKEKAAKEKEEKLKAGKKPEEKKAEEVKEAPKAASGTAKVEFSKDGDIERLRFTSSNPVPAAVFERFGYYWMVFYTDEQLELPENLKESKLFGATKKIAATKSDVFDSENYPKPVATPLVFNLELVQNAFAMAEKNGNEWLIELDPNIKYEQENPSKLQTGSDVWIYNAPGLSGRVTIKDELTNDYLDVFPLAGNAYVDEKKQTAKFIAEKTVQGIALKPIGQYETRNDEKDKLKIIRPAPVATTTASAQESATSADEGMRALFPFEKWKQLDSKDYRKAEQKLQNGDRFEFGKFLFSQGLYAEAAVNLMGVPGLQASFLTAASFYMTGRYEEALRLFDALSLPGDVDPNELLLWQAASNYELYKVAPSTTKPVDLSSFKLARNFETYPDVVKSRLLFSLAEKLIEEAKFDSAQAYVNMLGKLPQDTAGQNYLKYLQARIHDGQNKKARAYEIWQEVANSKTDRESQAKSTFEMINQDYSSGKATPEDTIKRLNDIRILWRGEMFEYKLLNMLGDVYAKAGNELDALRTYKEMLTSFPRFPNNLTVAATMRELFVQALKKDFSNKDNTFRAVTLYYEFEELRPSGEEGSQITLQLADSLAQYDLLDDSAKVLQKYAEGLTDPVQKAEIGTRIAILHYLNNKPKEALEALKASEGAGLPGYLTQERKILEIRCLIETAQYNQVLSGLSSLPDEQANRFRADVFWKQKEWKEMVDIYGLVPIKTDEDIMRIGLAYVLLNDKQGLQNLNREYDLRMEKSKYAETFNFITNTENVDYRNLDLSLSLDRAEGVLKQYREKLKDKGLAAPAPKPAPAQPSTPPATAPATPAAESAAH